jgi:hypothetical protein
MFNSDTDTSFAALGIGSDMGTPLTKLLMSDAIQPGSAPSYEACKLIFSYHPLGEILADGGMKLAQSQGREISIPVLGEKRLIEEYEHTWNKIDRLGGTVILNNLFCLSRVYGIASLGVGQRGVDPSTPIDFTKVDNTDIFFNVLDPLNTAGSLTLDQDPNSPAFLRPTGDIMVAGKNWHPSRIFPKLNGQAIYIDWSSSAYGFVGRSVYQRPFYALKSFLQSMITDQMVVQKAGLLVYNAENKNSIIDGLMQGIAAWKRGRIKAGVAGQVLQVGQDEQVQTLNMQNLDGAFGMARTNILKNIASGAGMPASIVNNETLTEGFGEGSEDAKKEIRYINYIREDMAPAYAFMDKIVQRKAWTPAFFDALKVEYPELKDEQFETWFHTVSRAFSAAWPNLEIEPDSEKSKNEDVKFKSAVALAEVLLPELGPENKAKVIIWLQENANEAEHLFASKLNLDEEDIASEMEAKQQTEQEMQAADPAPNAPADERT